MRPLLSAILAIIVFAHPLFVLSVSADEAEDAGDAVVGSGAIQTTDEINAFLIQAYRARIDQILADLRKNIAAYPLEIQIRVLKQVRISINEKIEELYSKDISDIRRKILSNILEYIIDEVQKDIRALEQQAGTTK
jgi:hypothetical protein